MINELIEIKRDGLKQIVENIEHRARGFTPRSFSNNGYISGANNTKSFLSNNSSPNHSFARKFEICQSANNALTNNTFNY